MGATGRAIPRAMALGSRRQRDAGSFLEFCDTIPTSAMFSVRAHEAPDPGSPWRLPAAGKQSTSSYAAEVVKMSRNRVVHYSRR
jgi:hypothetical protein